MPKDRIRFLGVVGVLATVGLLLALAVQVGSTAGSTGASGASSGSAVQGWVSIHLWGPGLGPRNPGRGRFELDGVWISDRGRFVDDREGEPGRGVRTFFGAKGTIRVSIGHFGFWRITKGTKAYAGLRGRGTGANLSPGNQGPVEIFMEGTVSQ